MAINFTISYTFSPSSTISSSQVNTNFSDEASVWQGLEAVTKSLARLQVDAAPTVAADVVRKDYVDHLTAYRRPVLVANTGTVVNIETGINGTSAQAQILFPDGNLRQDSTTGRINCNVAQVAALSGTAQSGLRTGTVANNTWYAIYAVKTSDNASNFVAVADTVLPLVTNFATLNSNFGTNSWVYLGLIRNGDNASSPSGFLAFQQCGNFTIFRGLTLGNAANYIGAGIRLATTAGATSLTFAAGSTGTGAAQIPVHVSIVNFGYGAAAGSGTNQVADASASGLLASAIGTAINVGRVLTSPVEGLKVVNGSSVAMDIVLCGFADSVLGVGSNPIL